MLERRRIIRGGGRVRPHGTPRARHAPREAPREQGRVAQTGHVVGHVLQGVEVRRPWEPVGQQR